MTILPKSDLTGDYIGDMYLLASRHGDLKKVWGLVILSVRTLVVAHVIGWYTLQQNNGVFFRLLLSQYGPWCS